MVREPVKAVISKVSNFAVADPHVVHDASPRETEGRNAGAVMRDERRLPAPDLPKLQQSDSSANCPDILSEIPTMYRLLDLVDDGGKKLALIFCSW
jgi:hypothetical protein